VLLSVRAFLSAMMCRSMFAVILLSVHNKVL
jgi:hypothetical protein